MNFIDKLKQIKNCKHKLDFAVQYGATGAAACLSALASNTLITPSSRKFFVSLGMYAAGYLSDTASTQYFLKIGEEESNPGYYFLGRKNFFRMRNTVFTALPLITYIASSSLGITSDVLFGIGVGELVHNLFYLYLLKKKEPNAPAGI